MNPPDDQKLENLIHRTLRDLPPRRAPQSLQWRVLAAIEQRAALPWWRKSFVHWPLAARAAFIILSVGMVVASVQVVAGIEAIQLRGAFLPQFAWIDAISAVVSMIAEFFSIVRRNIPPLWLYGGLAFVGIMYATLFALGAVAYRTLYAGR